jgi:hypothetical protein
VTSQRDLVRASLQADDQRTSHHGVYPLRPMQKLPPGAPAGGYVQDPDGAWHASRSPLRSDLARTVETLRQPVELCTCHVGAPDEFGNRDLDEDPGCPVHAA